MLSSGLRWSGYVVGVALAVAGGLGAPRARAQPEPAELLKEALAAAREIQAPAHRGSALVDIARGLVLLGEREAALEALTEACAILDEIPQDAQASLLDRIVPLFEEADLSTELVELAQQLRSPLAKARLLATAAAQRALSVGRTVTVGEPVVVRFPRGSSELRFSFEGFAGLPYVVETSQLRGVDTVLSVDGPDGTELGENDDVPEGGLASRLPFTALTDGMHTVRVGDIEEGQGEDRSFQLSVKLGFGAQHERFDCEWPEGGRWEGALVVEAATAYVLYVLAPPGPGLRVSVASPDGQQMAGISVPAEGHAIGFAPAEAAALTLSVAAEAGPGGSCTLYVTRCGNVAPIVILPRQDEGEGGLPLPGPGFADMDLDDLHEMLDEPAGELALAMLGAGDEDAGGIPAITQFLLSVGADFTVISPDQLPALKALLPHASVLLIGPAWDDEQSRLPSGGQLTPLLTEFLGRGGRVVCCSPGNILAETGLAVLEPLSRLDWGVLRAEEAATAHGIPAAQLLLCPYYTRTAHSPDLVPLIVSSRGEMVVGMAEHEAGRIVYLGFPFLRPNQTSRMLLLWALGLQGPAEEAAAAGIDIETLNVGEAAPVEFTREAADVVFAAEFAAGLSYVVETTDLEDCDTVLTIAAPDGEQIAQNDDHDDHDKASLVAFDAPEAGEYLIVVSSARAWRGGSCVVHLSQE